MRIPNYVDSYSISDVMVQSVVDDVVKSFTKERYVELLVQLGLYSYDTLHDAEYYGNNKRGLIIKTFKELSVDEGDKLLSVLRDRKALSTTTINAFRRHRIEIDQSLAGELAEPTKEQSYLEDRLSGSGYESILNHLNQSYESYLDGRYEASNAMIRAALEGLIQSIAEAISAKRGNEIIPKRRHHYCPVDYREYLRKKDFIDESEKQLLDNLYNYSSKDGSHPGISSEAEARLRRFMIIGISLLLLDKLDNSTFMSGIVK